MVISKIPILKNKTPNRILVSVILALFSILAVVFTGNLLLNEKKAVIAKRTELAGLQKDLELLDKILVDQKNNEEKIKTASRTLPASFKEVAFFISQIEGISSKNGQELETKIEEVPTPEQNDLLGLGISLEISGAYSSFSEMLTDLTHLPYHTRVDSLKVEETGGKISSLVNLRLYLAEKGEE